MFSRIKAQRLCHGPFANFTDYWALHRSVYHPQKDRLVERFICTLKTKIRKFVHEMTKIGIDGWSPCFSQCARSPKPLQGFPPSSFSTDVSPVGCFGRSKGNMVMLDMGVIEESNND